MKVCKFRNVEGYDRRALVPWSAPSGTGIVDKVLDKLRKRLARRGRRSPAVDVASADVLGTRGGRKA